MVNINELIYNWSFALYDLARDDANLPQITNEAAEIVKTLKKNKLYLNVLDSFDLEENQKFSYIDEVFGKFHPYLLNTIKLASRQHVIKYIIIILHKFVELSNEKQKIKYGTIYTVMPLTQEEIHKFEEKLSHDLSAQVHLINQIMPELIAGIRIKVDDYLIDNSVDGQLTKMKKIISKNN